MHYNSWCMIETSSDLLQKPLAVFGYLRKSSENVVKNVPVDFGQLVFSSDVEKYFLTLKEKFCISAGPCYILYVTGADLGGGCRVHTHPRDVAFFFVFVFKICLPHRVPVSDVNP